MKILNERLFVLMSIVLFSEAGISQSIPYTFENALKLGGSLNDVAEHVVVTNSESIITFGQFRSTVNFNPQEEAHNLTALGNPDLFLASHSSAGELNWALNLGRIALTDGLNTGGLFANSDESIVITGAFSSIVNFNPLGINTSLSAVAGKDAFIAKYNEQGILLWVKSFGDIGFESGSAVTSDDDSNLYVAISFAGQIDVDPGPSEVLLQSAGESDAVIIKLSPNGDYLWHRHISTPGNDEISAIGCSINTDRLGLTGHINGTIEAIPQSELFGSIMTQDGSEVWTINYNNISTGNRMRKVAFDQATGLVFFGGEIQTTTDFNPGADELVVNPLFRDIFVACYDPFESMNSSFRFVVSPRGAGIAENLAYMHPHLGKLYFGGSFDVDIQFEEGNGESYFTSAGQRDIFTSVYYLNGLQPVFALANIFGGEDDEFGANGVIHSEILAMSGSFVPTLELNQAGAPLVSTGGRDAFWARFSCPLNLSTADNPADLYHINIFPVPASERLHFDIKSDWQGAVKVRLISAVGKELNSFVFLRSDPNPSIPVSSLSNGIYFLEFEINGNRITKRFVKN